MNISEEGLELIRKSESLRLNAYLDAVGILTIGYGHTGKDVTEDMTVTEAQTEELLRKDILVAERCIKNCVLGDITQGQFDALCSFVFNLGCLSLRNSTLLRKLNEGDDAGAAEEFRRWNHAGGMVLAGLTKRREEERNLFLT